MQFITKYLSTPIEYLKGVGPTKGKLLREELSILDFYDLLNYFPLRHIDKSHFTSVRNLTSKSDYVQLLGTLYDLKETGFKGKTRLTAKFRDQFGEIDLIWFQGASWLKDKLTVGKTYKLYGKVSLFKGRLTIAHPELTNYTPGKQDIAASFEPIYSSTEKLRKKGLDTRGILKLVRELFKGMQLSDLPEFFSQEIIDQFSLIGRARMYRSAHFPKTIEEFQASEYRLKFEDLFIHQLNVLKIKIHRYETTPGPKFTHIGEKFNQFFHKVLPFELTGAQKRVLKEIRKDVAHGRHMNRLLQGDVGSGKTIVALMTALMAIDNGFQAALMAPTEILAIQHYESIKEQLEPLKIKVGLLTGSVKGEKRKTLFHSLKTGYLDLLIGTHALIEDPVKFKNLGIAIIDEQHRFGVAQRAKLWKKRSRDMAPHILVMTATPIPRTLAMTSFGDLDVSIIDELPPGRKPIITLHKTDSYRLRIIGFMKEEIAKGRQIYIVYPLIESNEKLDLKDLFTGFEDLEHNFPYPEYGISMVHGRMKPAEKEAQMKLFSTGKTQIMIATTVIEVGVNVPNATVMIIENATRFGLAQLHQLRGRVGRGGEQSYCILMTKKDLNPNAKKRMDTMVRTNNGFEIAEVDLELRGQGDLEGTQQSGQKVFRKADILQDKDILYSARECVLNLLEEDPELKEPKNRPLFEYLTQMPSLKTFWSKIS